MKEYRLPDDTVSIASHKLRELVETIPGKLKSISAADFSRKPSPGKWSKKEIIGHLIDSATNNHHRFVRAQFDDKPLISYDQVLWNQHSYYHQMDQHHLISLWEIYNRHLLDLIRLIPDELKKRECTMGEGGTYSIEWVFEDYVRHLEHHLNQIFEPVQSGIRIE